MSDCTSAYTIDRRTGEKLTCERENGHRWQHSAEYGGVGWYWADVEADRPAGSAA
jgi:hypothetical protein